MKTLLSFFVVFFALAGNYAVADDNREIEFLLSFVASSDCVFIRNGKEYQGNEASEHLTRKYDYAKGRIRSAEDFINKIASKSSMTRRPYLVHCSGKEMLAGEWFSEALVSYRATVAK